MRRSARPVEGHATAHPLHRHRGQPRQAGATLKMLMRPLDLPPPVQAALQFPIEHFMQRGFPR